LYFSALNSDLRRFYILYFTIFYVFPILEASSIRPPFHLPFFGGVLVAVVATIIIVAVVIVLVIRSRGHGEEDKRLPKNNGGLKPNSEHDKSAVPLKKPMDDMLEIDDKNPDVVPHSSGTSR